MRPRLYVTIGLIIGILGVVGALEAASFRKEYETVERQRLQETLDDAIDRWETDLATRIEDGTRRMMLLPDPTPEIQELRREGGWFDSFYLWRDGALVYPEDVPVEDIAALRAEPCIAAASRTADPDDRPGSARRFLSCVGPPDGAVSAFAVSEALQLLLDAEDPRAALALAQQSRSFYHMPFQAAASLGIAPRRVLTLRLTEADILDMFVSRDRGTRDLGDQERMRLVLDILVEDGPVLEQVLPSFEDPLVESLRPVQPRFAAEADQAHARLQRRVAAWRELATRVWTPEALRELDRGPKLEIDPQGDPPWLLYAQRLDTPGGVAVVQLDPEELLVDFLRRSGRLQPFVRFEDATGGWRGGAEGTMQVRRNFSRVLPTYLVVGLTEGVGPTSHQDRLLVLQLSLIVVGVVVGGVALYRTVRSDREIEQLIQSQQEFLTRVTHELKTPIAGIRLTAENLEFGAYGSPEEVSEAAQRIVAEADRLNARVEEVLVAARGVVQEPPALHDLGLLARELVEQWRPRVELVGGTLEAEIPAKLQAVVNRRAVRDAWTNLLDNALKYRREDRALRVRARLRTVGRQVVFEVADNGLGVPADMRTAIFERFRRVEGDGRGKSGGHGLGLHFVAEAARLHGGKVECREGEDGGARFVFRFPRRS